MKKQIFLLLFSGFLLTTVILTVVPNTNHSAETLATTTGTVEMIYETDHFDIIVKLKENDSRYLIKRGIEQGLSTAELTNKLLFRRVVIKYPQYWLPLQKNKPKELSTLIYQNEVIYTTFSTDLITRN